MRGPMAAGEPAGSLERAVPCLFHSSPPLSLGGGVGAVPSLFLDLGSLSLLWNAFTVSLQPPPPPFRLD